MSARPAVMYVTYDGLLEPLGASQVLPYVRGLRRRGFPMEVLSFEKPRDLARAGAVDRLRASLRDEGIPWTARRYHRSPALPATLHDVVIGRRHVARWAREARSGGDGALVHARGYLPGLMGLAARRHGARLLFDMRGFWVDERIEAGFWRAGSAQVRIGRWIERTLLGSSDHLVLLTERAVERLDALAAGASWPAHTVVPTCVDLERFAPPESPERVRAELGLGDGPVLTHVGNVIGWYDGELTARIGRAFVERTGGTFVVLTHQLEDARRLTEAAGVPARVEAVPPEFVPAWLQASDVGLALVRPTPAKDASFPTKVGEYLASGMAVLTTDIGDLRGFADDRVVRLHARAESAEEAASWLVEAASRSGRSTRARALAEERLALDTGLERLAGVYRELGIRAA